EVITLNGVAPMVLKGQGPRAARDYAPYELPKGVIVYPRDDTVKQVLSLRDLKEPIKTGWRELDEINKKLVEGKKAGDKKVQILVNAPRSILYVATAVHTPPPSRDDFRIAYQHAPGFPVRDALVDEAQIDAGKTFRQQLIAQLRNSAEVKV